MKFNDSLKMDIIQCLTCKEALPLSKSSKKLNAPEYECVRCKREKGSPKKFSKENDMIPGEWRKKLNLAGI